MNMTAGKSQTIYLVSDGTCRTCEQVVKAALLQFKAPETRLVRKANVRTADTVAAVIAEAAQRQSVVFYTLVSYETRQAIHEAVQRHMVRAVDLLGPALAGLHEIFESVPHAVPGMLYKTNKEYFERIDAVEYTLHHDDGRAVHELAEADVVLVGVSRSSKSTTCFYLAYWGIRAANVPLFADSPPPPELLRVDPRKVIGLQTNPHRLQTIRRARLQSWGDDVSAVYADKVLIAGELLAANELMARQGWRRIDVSYKAVEEVAHEVIQLLRDAGVEPGAMNSPD